MGFLLIWVVFRWGVWHTRLIAQETIEEKIMELQQAKQSMAEAVTGSADGAILSMKPEELLELLEVPEG